MSQTFVCAACARINGPSADTCSKCGGNEFVREELDLHAVGEFVAVSEPPAVAPQPMVTATPRAAPKRVKSRREQIAEEAFPRTVPSRKRWRA